MTLTFETPNFNHAAVINAANRADGTQVCEQSFGNLFCWSACAKAEVAIFGDSFVARWGSRYAAPIGPQKRALIEQLLADGVTRLICIDDRYKDWLEAEFPGKFSFREKRDSADYIYERARLAALSGKKLAAKRNHINYFEQQHQWEVRPLTAENLAEVAAFNDWWCMQNHGVQDPSLLREGCAVRRGLEYFEQLGYQGLVLYAEGKVCAFTYGERTSEDSFCVHVEKADADLRGAYPMINRELAKSLPEQVLWLNREDDTGDEGLRKAKLSYRPDLLLMKYEAEVIK